MNTSHSERRRSRSRGTPWVNGPARRGAPRLRFAALGMTWVCAFLAASIACAAESDAWRQANEEFAAGRFRESLELYQSLANAGETSVALFYNIGNAHYRLGELGEAILNYERALALEPQHPEAAA